MKNYRIYILPDQNMHRNQIENFVGFLSIHGSFNVLGTKLFKKPKMRFKVLSIREEFDWRWNHDIVIINVAINVGWSNKLWSNTYWTKMGYYSYNLYSTLSGQPKMIRILYTYQKKKKSFMLVFRPLNTSYLT